MIKPLIKLRNRFTLPLKWEWAKRRKAKKAGFKTNVELLNKQLQLESLWHKYEREGLKDQKLIIEGKLEIINWLLNGSS